MTKTSKEGIYTRQLSNGDIAYIITYRANNKLYKRKLGTKLEGWTVTKAYNERRERSKSFSKVESSITLEEAFKAYYRSIQHKRDSKGTWGRFYNHIHDDLGHIPLNDIKPLDVLKLRNRLSEKTSVKTNRLLAPRTVDYMISIIHTIYQHHNKFSEKPVTSPASTNRVERFNPDNSRRRYLTIKEIDELYYMIRYRNDFSQNKNMKEGITKELQFFTKISLSTGARLNSVLTIRKKDIDFERGVVTIMNHKSKRIYKGYLPEKLCKDLHKWCLDCSDNNFIFGKSQLSRRPNVYRKKLQPILDKCFNEHITDRRDRVVIHTLRHTFASHLAIQGTPIYTIMKLLDHGSIEQTMRYAKLSPNQGQDEVAKLKLF